MEMQENPYRASAEPIPPPQGESLTRIPLILGILLFLLGALGAIAVLFMLLLLMSPDLFNIPEESRKALDTSDPVILSGQFLNLATVLSELVAAIGLIRYRRWARQATFVYAGLALVSVFTGIAVQYYVNGQIIPPNVPKAMHSYMLTTMAMGFAFSVLLPIVSLLLMFKQKVINALS